MNITEEEKEQIKRWIAHDERHAAELNNEWLRGLYIGEATAYKTILQIAKMA